MKEIMRTLLEIQSLDMKQTQSAAATEALTVLRRKIPEGILQRYDRLRTRGKTGIAPVHHETCSACHMHVRLATILTLKHGDTPQSCDSCGRYLYLSEEPEKLETAVAAPKTARKQKNPARQP
jgi:predicted  nucleic acid-binding Zn-ribbon protein